MNFFNGKKKKKKIIGHDMITFSIIELFSWLGRIDKDLPTLEQLYILHDGKR